MYHISKNISRLYGQTFQKGDVFERSTLEEYYKFVDLKNLSQNIIFFAIDLQYAIPHITIGQMVEALCATNGGMRLIR